MNTSWDAGARQARVGGDASLADVCELEYSYYGDASRDMALVSSVVGPAWASALSDCLFSLNEVPLVGTE